MSGAIPSKSDAGVGNPDVIYVPDPPGLMKTGGLHPIAVTLPLELSSQLRGVTLLRLAFVAFFVAFAVYSAITGRDLVLGALAAVCCVWFGPALVSLTNRLIHRGPVVRLSSDGIEYRILNDTAFSCRWVDVAEARFVGVMEPEHPGNRDVLRLGLHAEVASTSKALQWLSFSVPWPFSLRWRSLPKNTVLLPINDLSMTSEDVCHVIESLLLRHGKAVSEKSLWG